jgi:hypothetical protein
MQVQVGARCKVEKRADGYAGGTVLIMAGQLRALSAHPLQAMAM